VTFEQPDAHHALLVVEGEIDTLTAGSLERALTEVLVVDLSAVTFLASSGLAVLIRAAHQAGDRRLRLVSTARAVRRPMEITGSDQLFDLYPDRTAALSPEE
jgi:anti-sigma B factor antagonist